MGIYLVARAKDRHILHLGSQFIESDALISTDWGYLDAIARAISAAMTFK